MDSLLSTIQSVAELQPPLPLCQMHLRNMMMASKLITNQNILVQPFNEPENGSLVHKKCMLVDDALPTLNILLHYHIPLSCRLSSLHQPFSTFSEPVVVGS